MTGRLTEADLAAIERDGLGREMLDTLIADLRDARAALNNFKTAYVAARDDEWRLPKQFELAYDSACFALPTEGTKP